MWKFVALASLLALAGLAALVASQPSRYRLERSARIEAPPQMVRDQIVDLKRWASWSPRERRDPAIHRTYGGPSAGTGASYYWSGNRRVGQGRLTVISAGAEKVELERELRRPRPSLADLEVRLTPDGTGTRVGWIVTGERDFIDKALALLARSDRRASAEIEEGLAGLRSEAEAEARVAVFRLERSALLGAPLAKVMAALADLRAWPGWSPWEPPEATATRTYGGPSRGRGSSYYWTAHAPDVRGRVTVIRSASRVLDLELERWSARSWSGDAEIRLAPEGDGTRVTWNMAGREEGERSAGGSQPVGPELEKELEMGLIRLKAVVEAPAGRPR